MNKNAKRFFCLLLGLLLGLSLLPAVPAHAEGETDLSGCWIDLDESVFAYDGKEHKPKVTVTDGNTVYTEGVDYALEYYYSTDGRYYSQVFKCVEVGEYKVWVTSLDGEMTYAGTTFRIVGDNDLNRGSISLSPEESLYNGKDQTPAVTVKDVNGKVLTEGVDYTLEYLYSYKDENGVVHDKPVTACIEAGYYVITANGIGSYTGSRGGGFNIFSANELRWGDITLSETAFVYDGKDHKPAVTVKDASGKTLTEGTDYTVEYFGEETFPTGSVGFHLNHPITECIEENQYMVRATGIGAYTGELSAYFNIASANDLSLSTITVSETAFVYDGKDHKPTVTVKDVNGKTLTEGTDYSTGYYRRTDSWSYTYVTECVELGVYCVTVYGQGKYTGYKNGNFKTGDFEIVESLPRLPGDVNGDGQVNGKDVTRLCRSLAGYAVEIVDANADVNADGKVNGKDLTRLCRALAGYDVELK